MTKLKTPLKYKDQKCICSLLISLFRPYLTPRPHALKCLSATSLTKDSSFPFFHLSLLQLPLHAFAPSPPNVVGTGHLPELVFDLVVTLPKPICFTHVNITKKLNYIPKKGPVSLTTSKLL